MKLREMIAEEASRDIDMHTQTQRVWTGETLAAAITARLHECVRGLEWESPCAANNWIYVARSPWGDYGIHIDGGRHRAWLEAYVKPYERWLGDDDVGSVYEAQSAAQSHYAEQSVARFEP